VGIGFTKMKGPLELAAVEAFSRNFKIKLPKDYQEFLLNVNGGVPQPSHYTCPFFASAEWDPPSVDPFELRRVSRFPCQARAAAEKGIHPHAKSEGAHQEALIGWLRPNTPYSSPWNLLGRRIF
jgi:hypothetical protein